MKKYGLADLDSLRIRQSLIVLMAGLPALFAVAFLLFDGRRHLSEEIGRRAELLAQDVAAQIETTLLLAEERLTIISNLPQVAYDDEYVCADVLQRVKTSSRRYTEFVLADVLGTPICASAKSAADVNFADRGYFQAALANRSFAVGEMTIGRLSAKPVLPVALPMADDQGALVAVLITAIDLAWLEDNLEDTSLPRGMTISILDSQHKVLMRYPRADHLIGDTYPDHERLAELSALGDRGSLRSSASGSFAAREVLTQLGGLNVLVTASTHSSLSAFVRDARWITVGVLIAYLAMSLGAWWASRRFVTGPILRLRHVAGRFGAGDLKARTNLPKATGEIGGLAAAFDEMAASIEVREAELAERARELTEINRELRDNRDQLAQAQKMETIGQLAGGIAHDFNNILSIILGNLQLLQRKIDGDPEFQKRIDPTIEAANRAASLTRRLLAFSRRQTLTPEIVDFNEMIHDLEPMLHRIVGETIDLRIESTAALWSAEVDRNQLENALLNLAVNARDAMPEGGKLIIGTRNTHLDEEYARRHVEVTAGPYVQITVSDTGSGIPADIIAKVFDPFFTTKPKDKGTGLGLSMVHGFVKQSGGHIAIYSEVGYGTSIQLCFPRAGEPVVGHETHELSKPTCGAPVQGAILVVDDQPEVRSVSVDSLNDAGHRVYEAESGSAALDILREERDIELLFTDVVMPGGMTGFDLARQARQEFPDLKVLCTSGFAEGALRHRRELSVDLEWIDKPFEVATLLEKVDSILKLSRAERKISL